MKIKEYIETNKNVRKLEIIAIIALLIVSCFSYVYGFIKLNGKPNLGEYLGEVTLIRNVDEEDYDEDVTKCDVIYENKEDKLIVTYDYEDYVKLDDEEIIAYKYISDDGTTLIFNHLNPSDIEVANTYRSVIAEKLMPIFNLANASIILLVSILVILLFGKFFSTYEKIWFISIMVLATIMAIIFPEESANGVNGIIIMLLYLLDTFLNILCELLISKQSRYNFLVSVLVEITEIIICLVLMYRFATMAVTLLFWLPIDIISFINWSKHKDEKESELTAVRRLKGYQELLIILAIIIWTMVVGYFLSGLDIQTDFLGGNKELELWIIYIDACASAVGIANGLFILFRLREQWIAWYLCALLEAIINILSGQYVLLILKLGYFTNTTYGYIKWSKYINSHNIKDNSLF